MIKDFIKLFLSADFHNLAVKKGHSILAAILTQISLSFLSCLSLSLFIFIYCLLKLLLFMLLSIVLQFLLFRRVIVKIWHDQFIPKYVQQQILVNLGHFDAAYVALIYKCFMFFTNTIRLTQGIKNIKVPLVDISNFLSKQGNYQNDCQKIAQIFRKYGLVIINDPRVNAAQNDIFLNLMERYFTKRSKQFYQGNKSIDFSPEHKFQVGFMHQFQQRFQGYQEQKRKLKQPNQSLTPFTPARDPKWRFHWKVGNQINVLPSDFPEWQTTMNQWGLHMKNGCLSIAQMLAIGLGLQSQYITSRLIKGDFMLSPTAVDLARHKQGDVLAAFHRDFDLFTIHGKARFPGLFSWLNTGEKFIVQVPQGHLLIQAGKQLQWVTGGYITAGFHEVVYSKEVQESKQKAKEKGKLLWRISSTMFCQMQGGVMMKPHQKFASQESNNLYPPISAADYLNQELYSLTELK